MSALCRASPRAAVSAAAPASGPSASAPPLPVSAAVFELSVVRLLYDPDSSAVWRTDSSTRLALHAGIAGAGAASGQGSPGRAAAVRQMAPMAKSLTYGEVKIKSIAADVAPLLGLRDHDVVADLGGGTGKIALQLALIAQARELNVRTLSLEIAPERADMATAAYERLKNVTVEQAERCLMEALSEEGAVATAASSSSSSPSPSSSFSSLAAFADTAPALGLTIEQVPAAAEQLVAALRAVAPKVRAIRADMLASEKELADVTIVFVNNTVFEAPLMEQLVALLKRLPQLRAVVTLRELCSKRHGHLCEVRSSPCCAFRHPPKEGRCEPSWCGSTTLYHYVLEAAAEAEEAHALTQLQPQIYSHPPSPIPLSSGHA